MQRAFDLIVKRIKEECLGGRADAGSKAIEIVNQVASEYFKENYFNLDNTKLHDCPKCGEKATHRVNKKGSWACGCFKCGLFKSSYDHVKAIQAWEDYCGEYGGGWIPVEERLPEVETEVLIHARRKYTGGHIKDIITTAMYEDGTVRENDSCWRWEDVDGEWDEEEDCLIIPEGWWENKHYNPDGELNLAVDDKVIEWMPLPKLPLPEPYKAESEE